MSSFNSSSSSKFSSLFFTFISFILLYFLCHSPCFLASKTPTKIGKGYRLISFEELPDGGFLGLLQVKKKNNIYGPDIPLLRLFVKHETENRLRIQITDAKTQRWEVPYELLPREKPPDLHLQYKTMNLSRKTKENNNSIVETSSLSLEYVGNELIFGLEADPFNFIIKRKSNNETLFNTKPEKSDPFNEIVFKDQYLEMSTKLPKDGSSSLYGLGENTQPHGIKLYPKEPYTLYTNDVSAIYLNADLYGSHPMYMEMRNVNGGEATSNTHAVLLMNSNGMDVFYRGDSLTYKVIGGIFDFYFFGGPSPLDVVDQYTQLVGRPAPMPYWSFGFHQCRWGYHNLSVVEDVVEKYKKAKIPLDVIWNDDDHMDNHKDFTLNPISYPQPKLLEFINKIHDQGMHYIVLIDPGIGVNKTYGVYERGIANDVFIKYEGKPYLAQVWPGAVNFPDYLNPKTVEWWGDEIRRFHDLVPVDGLWIDMNEVSNFCSGLCTIPQGTICPNGTGPGWVCCLDCKNITNTKWDDPPYKINASGIDAPIGYKTIATSAYHYNGVKEYDAHSLYGFSETIATHKALLDLQGKRPFILSRSTFVGSGRYTAHWTGDNKGTWDDLKYSISTMLNFGIFGVPMVGSDICGFYPAPTEELCNRWIEVGAFYPFSRDHANFYSPRQELYQWESVAESARNALGMRYKLLPYLYTLSYEAHTCGAPIARPLFFTFPNLVESYGLSTQFLLGSSVMVSPVLEANMTKIEAFFPPGSWYNLFDMTQVIVSKKAHYVTLDAPLHVVNVHLYQNAILPMQQGGVLSKEARTTPFTLIVAFPLDDLEGEAQGKIFLDDDELPEMKLGNGFSTYIDLYATKSNGTVKIWSDVQEGKFALDKGLIIEKVIVLGSSSIGGKFGIEVDGNPIISDFAKVWFSEKEMNCLNSLENEEELLRTNMMVEVNGLDFLVGKKFSMSWEIGIKG